MGDRRQFLKKMLLVAAAGAVVPASAWAGVPPVDRYLWRMLQGIPVGETFSGTWRLIEAYPLRAGAIILVIAEDGAEPVRVDVVRRGPSVRAPAYTDFLELYVMDGGAGRGHIRREMVEALQQLADRLQDNEAQWLLAEELLTHDERLRRYPAFMARAACELSPSDPDIMPRKGPQLR